MKQPVTCSSHVTLFTCHTGPAKNPPVTPLKLFSDLSRDAHCSPPVYTLGIKRQRGWREGGGEAITQAQGLSVQRKEQHIRRIHTTAAAVTQQEAAKWTVCPYIRQHSLDGRRDTTTPPPHPTPTHPLQAKDVADLAWS